MPSWCHCHSLSLASVKSRLVLLFWYRLTRVVPDEGLLNGCVCTEKNEREKTKNQSFTAFLTHSQKRRPAFNRYLYEQFTKSVSISKIFLYKTVPSFVSNVLNRLELTSSATSAVPGATERKNDKETETDCRSTKPCSQRRTELNWTNLLRADTVTWPVIGHARQRHEVDWLQGCSLWIAVRKLKPYCRSVQFNSATWTRLKFFNVVCTWPRC